MPVYMYYPTVSPADAIVEETPKAKHSPASPTHTSIEEIAKDTFLVRSKTVLNAFLTLSRNMVIIRHNGNLSLVNPVRLTDSGETELKSLGKIKHLIRLGHCHGKDDAYYKDTFKAKLWAPGASKKYLQPAIDNFMKEGDVLPFPDSELFVFDNCAQENISFGNCDVSEAALLIRKSKGGILLTGESLQHYGKDRLYISRTMKLLHKANGFYKASCFVERAWLNSATPEGGSSRSLKHELQRLLLQWDFDQMIAAHGCFCKENAKEECWIAVESAFKN